MWPLQTSALLSWCEHYSGYGLSVASLPSHTHKWLLVLLADACIPASIMAWFILSDKHLEQNSPVNCQHILCKCKECRKLVHLLLFLYYSISHFYYINRFTSTITMGWTTGQSLRDHICTIHVFLFLRAAIKDLQDVNGQTITIYSLLTYVFTLWEPCLLSKP